MFGWLTPRNQFIECGMWAHLSVILQNDEARSITDLVEIESHLEYVEEGCQELIDQDEHPEWHTYEMACSDAAHDMVKILYDHQFIRIAQKGDRVHFEGRPNALKDAHQRCKDFAEGHACTAEFDSQGK